MRDIKFRAWDEQTKDMVYPSNDLGFASADILKRYNIVMQSTGLKDKNCKDIYEGDIIVKTGWCPMTVAFYLGAFGYYDRDGQFFPLGREFLFRWGDDKSQHVEIVSNIYENKELLEER